MKNNKKNDVEVKSEKEKESIEMTEEQEREFDRLDSMGGNTMAECYDKAMKK